MLLYIKFFVTVVTMEQVNSEGRIFVSVCATQDLIFVKL